MSAEATPSKRKPRGRREQVGDLDESGESGAVAEAGDAQRAAAALGELFPAVYLKLHRRDAAGTPQVSGASRGVMLHLASAGPLTIGELAQHLSRAQSVISEIVDHLERDGLLERLRDPRDRRRVLVWLGEVGVEALEREREVLSRELVQAAMTAMTSAERAALLGGMRALVRAAGTLPPSTKKQTRRTR